jgi:hypothetical protein
MLNTDTPPLISTRSFPEDFASHKTHFCTPQAGKKLKCNFTPAQASKVSLQLNCRQDKALQTYPPCPSLHQVTTTCHSRYGTSNSFVRLGNPESMVEHSWRMVNEKRAKTQINLGAKHRYNLAASVAEAV